MTRYTIDRFEDGGWTVLEDDLQRTVTVPRGWLPASAREGDVLILSHHDKHAAARTLRFELDATGRDARLKNARRLRRRLTPGPKGDISS